MKASIKTAVLTGLLSVLWLMPLHAQDDENDGIATTVLITPKAGHEEELIKAITEYHHFVAQFEGHFRYTWYEIQTGPHTGKYAARSGNHNWADFDAEYEWQKEAGAHFEKNVAPHIDKLENTITEEMDEFMYWPENWEGYSHFWIQDWYVKSGQYSKFRRGLKQIVDTLRAGNFPNYFGFYSVVSGGYGGQIRLVTAHKGWSDMVDKEPTFYQIMSESLGGQEAFETFMSDWGSTFKEGANWTVARMEEASDYGD